MCHAAAHERLTVTGQQVCWFAVQRVLTVPHPPISPAPTGRPSTRVAGSLLDA